MVRPLVQSVNHAQPLGRSEGLRYTRYGNTPNAEAVQERLALLEGAEAALVLASGMGATACAMMALLRPGDHLVSSAWIYGGSHALFTRELAQLVSNFPRDTNGQRHFVVCSGGGPSIMEAANRGAADVHADSIGLNIVLPHEQAPNPYVTPSLSLQFHYFALRKMHFLLHARALAAFPGGFGTFDELFELLTLIQTGKIQPIPVLLFGREFWERVINFDALVEEGVVSERDLGIFTYVETAEEAWDVVRHFYEEQAKKADAVG